MDDFRAIARGRDHETSGGITLGQAASLLGKRWRISLLFAFLGLFLSLLTCLFITPQYSASVAVGAAETENQGNGAAGLSGVLRIASGGSSDNPQLQSYLFLVTSNKVAEQVDAQLHLLKVLHASEWDEATHSWHPPASFGFGIKQAIKGFLRLPQWSPPSSSDLASYFAAHITSGETSTLGVYRITMLYPDKDVVGPLLASILQNANEVLRSTDDRNSKGAESYLVSKLSSPTITSVDQRQALSRLLVEQEQRLLLVNMRKDYIATPIDNLSVSSSPAWPPTLIFLLLGALMGGIVAAVAVLIRG